MFLNLVKWDKLYVFLHVYYVNVGLDEEDRGVTSKDDDTHSGKIRTI